jgi:hypothetical protein
MHEQFSMTSPMQSADIVSSPLALCTGSQQSPIVLLGIMTSFSLAMLTLNGENLMAIRRRPPYPEFTTCFIIYQQCYPPEPPSEYFVITFILFALNLNLLYLGPNLAQKCP